MRMTKSELDEILKKNKHVTVEEPQLEIDDKIRRNKLIDEIKAETHQAFIKSAAKCGILSFTVPGIPIPAPRQTQRDKWMKRPCVMRYREYGDRLRSFINLHDMYVGKITMKFYLPMKSNLSLEKERRLLDAPHRIKPDGDNLCKAVQDALLKNDAMVWACYYEKRWCLPGRERTELTFETTE